MRGQRSLFGWDAPRIDASFGRVERIALDATAWIDRVPGWVEGHAALFEALRDAMAWRATRRVMYERYVDVPRLLASVPEDGDHPLLAEMAEALTARYRWPLHAITLALYRDGGDSVAWHRDRLENRDDSLVAVVTLGGPRTFRVRPHGGGRSRAWSVGWGDLMTMGGSIQRDWEHGVPKQRAAPPRLAIMFRESIPRPPAV